VKPLLELSQARIFFAGTLTDPQLNHPEGIAVAADGAIWCGGTLGEIYRIEPDGSRIERVASTGGFALGMDFDEQGRLYVCDLKHRAVFRLDPSGGELVALPLQGGVRPLVSPNVPVVDGARNCLYVSDSNVPHEPGPGIYRFDLESGEGELWYDRDLDFANGLALAADYSRLYVVESWGYRITAVPILEDGSPGEPEVVLDGFEGIADGLSLGPDGRLYVACYAPSRICRVDLAGGSVELLLHDPICNVLCHPTNVAWRGGELFAASLGGHNITAIDLEAAGVL
jgi:gluconolactonase